jgi:hypothetical protein
MWWRTVSYLNHLSMLMSRTSNNCCDVDANVRTNNSRAVPHKVKTVGMTDFTPAEVDQVQKGGNKEAKRFWHARLQEMPFNADLNDAKNVAQFIKLTFTDKKYVNHPSHLHYRHYHTHSYMVIIS